MGDMKQDLEKLLDQFNAASIAFGVALHSKTDCRQANMQAEGSRAAILTAFASQMELARRYYNEASEGWTKFRELERAASQAPTPEKSDRCDSCGAKWGSHADTGVEPGSVVCPMTYEECHEEMDIIRDEIRALKAPNPDGVALVDALIDSVEKLVKREMGPPEPFQAGEEFQRDPDVKDMKADFYAKRSALLAAIPAPTAKEAPHNLNQITEDLLHHLGNAEIMCFSGLTVGVDAKRNLLVEINELIEQIDAMEKANIQAQTRMAAPTPVAGPQVEGHPKAFDLFIKIMDVAGKLIERAPINPERISGLRLEIETLAANGLEATQAHPPASPDSPTPQGGK